LIFKYLSNCLIVKPLKMQNRLILVLCNLKPAKLRGVSSEAMVLCASTPDKVELLLVPDNAAIGDRVTVAGYEGTPEKEINSKNNIFAIVQPELKTNDDLVATYKGIPFEIKSKGVIKTSSLKNVPIK
jgi:aminoacyl tRNA synthase complex-interacting multifunctional protein 1